MNSEMAYWKQIYKNRHAFRTCGRAVTQRFVPYCQLSCVLSSRIIKLSLRSSNSTRYCFGTVYHYSAMVDVLGKKPWPE